MSDLLSWTENNTLWLSFNRTSKKNAITQSMYREMTEAMNQASMDENIRSIVITGEGGDFTAGNDLKDFASIQSPKDLAAIQQFLRCMSTLPKPFIAAVEGLAVGIGVTMLLHCDLVYATQDATFQMPFTQLGLCPEAGSSVLLPARIGHQRSVEHLLLGEPFTAEKGKQMGLINHCLPDTSALRAHTQAQADKVARLSPESVAQTKQFLRQNPEALARRIEQESIQFMRLLGTRAAQERIAKFFERA